MEPAPPLVTICIPHWQVKEMVTVCLRSIRKQTHGIPYEVLVVDNGSKDDSLDYLRSVKWIRLIERGDETPANWLRAFATALDFGIREGRGKYLLILHTDVIILREGWLQLLVDAIESDRRHAAAGTGKLENPGTFYGWWKRTMDVGRFKLWLRRTIFRDAKAVFVERPNCPRDFCALYRMDALRKHNLSFVQKRFSAGESMYLDLVEHGYTATMIPVPKMMEYVHHIAHATAGLRPNERRLNHTRGQLKAERRLRELFESPYVKELLSTPALDR